MDRHLNFGSFALAAVVFLALCFVGFRVWKKSTPQLPLPPGPKGLPFIGSVLEFNRNQPWLTYAEWKKSYGEIVSCNLLGQIYIIINSDWVAKKLLEQRSNIYSDRPLIRTTAFFGMDFNTAHLPYGDTWKSHRKIFHQGLGSSTIPKYYKSIADKVRTLLANLLCSSEDFENHMRTYAASVIMSVTYGYDVVPDDPLLAPMEELFHIVGHMTPEKAILLNLFPWLFKSFNLPSWFPGSELQELAKRCRELSPIVRDAPFQFVKEFLAKDNENDSMVVQLLKAELTVPQGRETYEQYIKDCATSSFIAGTDTTQSTLNTLIMALILNPEVQERAQSAIDKVVGGDRMPNFDDRKSLPYIDAVLRETLRWGSLVPMAIPHMVSKDDIFEQFLIPKGSVIVPNLWGMVRDEERFPDPTAFKPERHLDAEGNLVPDDISSLFFGYGRRICPGRHLADASSWLAAASMLSTFRFSKAVGPEGHEIDIIPKFTGGVALRPDPFLCSIKPRFEEEKAKELFG